MGITHTNVFTSVTYGGKLLLTRGQQAWVDFVDLPGRVTMTMIRPMQNQGTPQDKVATLIVTPSIPVNRACQVYWKGRRKHSLGEKDPWLVPARVDAHFRTCKHCRRLVRKYPRGWSYTQESIEGVVMKARFRCWTHVASFRDGITIDFAHGQPTHAIRYMHVPTPSAHLHPWVSCSKARNYQLVCCFLSGHNPIITAVTVGKKANFPVTHAVLAPARGLEVEGAEIRMSVKDFSCALDDINGWQCTHDCHLHDIHLRPSEETTVLMEWKNRPLHADVRIRTELVPACFESRLAQWRLKAEEEAKPKRQNKQSGSEASPSDSPTSCRRTRVSSALALSKENWFRLFPVLTIAQRWGDSSDFAPISSPYVGAFFEMHVFDGHVLWHTTETKGRQVLEFTDVKKKTRVLDKALKKNAVQRALRIRTVYDRPQFPLFASMRDGFPIADGLWPRTVDELAPGSDWSRLPLHGAHGESKYGIPDATPPNAPSNNTDQKQAGQGANGEGKDGGVKGDPDDLHIQVNGNVLLDRLTPPETSDMWTDWYKACSIDFKPGYIRPRLSRQGFACLLEDAMEQPRMDVLVSSLILGYAHVPPLQYISCAFSLGQQGVGRASVLRCSECKVVVPKIETKQKGAKAKYGATVTVATSASTNKQPRSESKGPNWVSDDDGKRLDLPTEPRPLVLVNASTAFTGMAHPPTRWECYFCHVLCKSTPRPWDQCTGCYRVNVCPDCIEYEVRKGITEDFRRSLMSEEERLRGYRDFLVPRGFSTENETTMDEKHSISRAHRPRKTKRSKEFPAAAPQFIRLYAEEVPPRRQEKAQILSPAYDAVLSNKCLVRLRVPPRARITMPIANDFESNGHKHRVERALSIGFEYPDRDIVRTFPNVYEGYSCVYSGAKVRYEWDELAEPDRFSNDQKAACDAGVSCHRADERGNTFRWIDPNERWSPADAAVLPHPTTLYPPFHRAEFEGENEPQPASKDEKSTAQYEKTMVQDKKPMGQDEKSTAQDEKTMVQDEKAPPLASLDVQEKAPVRQVGQPASSQSLSQASSKAGDTGRPMETQNSATHDASTVTSPHPNGTSVSTPTATATATSSLADRTSKVGPLVPALDEEESEVTAALVAIVASELPESS